MELVFENEHYQLYRIKQENGPILMGYLQKNINMSKQRLEQHMLKTQRTNGISFITTYSEHFYNVSIFALMVLTYDMKPEDIPVGLWSAVGQDYHERDSLVIAVEPNFQDVEEKDVAEIRAFVEKHKTTILNHFNKKDYDFDWYI